MRNYNLFFSENLIYFDYQILKIIDTVHLTNYINFFTCQIHFMLTIELFIQFNMLLFQCQIKTAFDISKICNQ